MVVLHLLLLKASIGALKAKHSLMTGIDSPILDGIVVTVRRPIRLKGGAAQFSPRFNALS